ncbi:MAG: potassium-transporting ATPase subunit KdpC [Pseudomonadota bacterium]|nr:potassium-transporting ATPase subunit KdpC [Pseudomonadota bacterium]
MRNQLRPALVIFAALMLITGIIYPMVMTGLARLAFPNASAGSLVERNGAVVGSALIGQAWTSDRYFWSRPSAAGDGYNAAASSGANLGATSQKLLDRIRVETGRLLAATGAASLPADAVTASGSGLDPHISPQYALLQVARIARARQLPEEQVRALVEARTQRPLIGLIGEPRVNVLLLNLALDGVSSG